MADTSPAVAMAPRAAVYSPKQACRHARITPQQLRSWQRQGLVTDGASLAYRDIISMRALARMQEAGLRGRKLRDAVDWLHQRLSEITSPLDEARVVRRGRRLFVKLPGEEVELWSGQIQLRFDGVEPPPVEARAKEKEVDLRQRRQEAERSFQHGLELEQQGAPVDQVIAAYRHAAELDEKSAGALVNLGTIYFNARMWKDSENYYVRALEADPSYPLAHFNLGNLFDERGDRDKARHHYEEALRLKTGYADAHYNVALLYQAQGQTMKALKHWRAYLKLDPASSWAAIARREMKKLQGLAVVEGKRLTELVN